MRLLFLNLLIIGLVLSEYTQDPYSVLGVSKRASSKEIKRAYKSLAKEWHPDKNENPEAQDKFVAISKAYELLNDPLKKERYDKFGTFDDSPHGGGHHGYGGGFDQFFGGGFGGFGGFEDGIFAKQRISLRQYTQSIVDRSHHQPFIIYAYSNYCQLCFRLQNQWKAAVDDLEPLGYGIGAVNAMTDGNLLEKLRISRLPAIVAIVEGRAIHLRADMVSLSARTIRMFARDVIPKTFLLPVNTHDKLKRFVDQWSATNKVSVLILGAAPEPRTRYLLTAMKHFHFARFAYVHLGANTAEVDSMRDALSIKCTQCENILIFNDYPESGPVARLSISNVNQLSSETLDTLIDKHKALSLPRLSSSGYLDELCPVSSRNPRHLCVILPVVDTEADAHFVDTWRRYAADTATKWNSLHVRLVYIYVNKQSEWMRPFLEKRSGQTEADARDVLVMWRMEHVKAKIGWLKSSWDGNREKMEKLIADVVSQRTRLEDTVAVGNVMDEFAPTWWTRWCRAAVRVWEAGWFHLSKEEAYPVLSAIGTLLVIIIVGYGLSYMSQESKMKKEKNRQFSSTEDNTWHPDDPKTKGDQTNEPPKVLSAQAKAQRMFTVMSPLMHELRAESYFGMIRLLKPGCRSLVVLVDEESKERLLAQFAQYIYPLRNNKTFSFGFLMVDKNLPWFRKLLEHTLPLGEENSTMGEGGLYEKLKSINPRQTVGTVLVLCGWKLYFSIYHPMHTTGKKGRMGDSDEDWSSSDEDEERGSREEEAMLRRSCPRLSTENVLNGFPIWLDRLLEGSIRRYYIPEWPENLH